MTKATGTTTKRRGRPPRKREAEPATNGAAVQELPEDEERHGVPHRQYKLQAGCPDCGRVPAVRFTEREVIRNRTERQGARVQNHQCSRCRCIYWIRAADIAGAKLDTRSAPLNVEAGR